jgi:NitT/TauT family transport system substrate-binding protein
MKHHSQVLGQVLGQVLAGLALLAFATLPPVPASAETITIGIGHQSTVTNTVPGGIILEKLKLLEKHLPKTGKYQDATYDIVYRDYTSGPPITNEMLAGKLAFGVMGDYPLIVNGAKFEATGAIQTRFIEVTGYNLKGTGNGVVVPVASDVYSLQQLAGKSVSTPFGSAAWGMFLKVLQDSNLSDKVTLVNQSPPVGVSNIAQGKIDAHVDFCPWSEVTEFRGTGRKIFDGSEAGIPTFHGTVVTTKFIADYPEIVQAYVDATLEAQDWIAADPLNAAIKVSEWTGIEKEVLYLYFSKGGISTFEASIKPQWVEALKYDHSVLERENKIPPLTFSNWIDDRFVRTAYQARGIDYDALKAKVVDTQTQNVGLADEIWHAQDGIKTYRTVADFLKAVAKFQGAHEPLNAVYVYDKPSGLKLFGKTAFYVKAANGEFSTFLRKPDAEAFAKAAGGSVLTFDQAWGSFAS